VVLVLAFCLPVAIFLGEIAVFIPNVPAGDDYSGILEFLVRWVQTSDPLQKLHDLLAQHAEHRVAASRLVGLSCYWLLGAVDFRVVTLVGGLLWVAVAATLIRRLCSQLSLPTAWLLPIPFLLFAPIHFENMISPLGAVQTYGVLLFAFWYLAALAADRLGLALLWFTAALFTSGGGLALYPVGIGCWLLRRRWSALAIFVLVATAVVAGYFWGYVPPPHQTTGAEIRARAWLMPIYALAFLGGVVPIVPVAVIAGMVATIGLLLIAVRTSSTWSRLVVAFLLIIAGLTAVTRSGFGVQQALNSRYVLYPLLTWSFLYAHLLHSLRARRPGLVKPVVWTGTAAALCYIAAGYAIFNSADLVQSVQQALGVRLPGIRSFEEVKSARLHSLEKCAAGDPSVLDAANPLDAARLLNTAIHLGIYDPPVRWPGQ
jgi:hypothetical protein